MLAWGFSTNSLGKEINDLNLSVSMGLHDVHIEIGDAHNYITIFQRADMN